MLIWHHQFQKCNCSFDLYWKDHFYRANFTKTLVIWSSCFSFDYHRYHRYYFGPIYFCKVFFDRSNFMKKFSIKRERTSVLSRLSGSISAKATATKADWNFIFLSKIYFSLSSYRSTFKIVIHQAIHQGLGGLASIITRSRHLAGTSQVRNRQSPTIFYQYLPTKSD